MTKIILQGSVNHFGVRKTEVDSPVDVPMGNLIRRIVMPIYTTAGSAACNVATDILDTINVIPAHSLIKSCYIYVEDAFTSTSSATGIDVGLTRASDGSTEIDDDGLIDVGTEGAKAVLTAKSWNIGSGALIGVESGAYDGIIVATWAGGTDTLAGTGVVVVEYIPSLEFLLGDKT